MLVGLLGGSLGVLVVAVAPTVPVVLAGWCVAQVFFNARGGGFTPEQWAQLAVTTAVWLVVPLAIGVRTLPRSEVT